MRPFCRSRVAHFILSSQVSKPPHGSPKLRFLCANENLRSASMNSMLQTAYENERRAHQQTLPIRESAIASNHVVLLIRIPLAPQGQNRPAVRRPVHLVRQPASVQLSICACAASRQVHSSTRSARMPHPYFASLAQCATAKVLGARRG